ncbi:hypothetical protein LINGRAHAP2_LOCUS8153 [Linum grandiflorum]
MLKALEIRLLQHNEIFKTDGKDLVANEPELCSISSKISVLKNIISCLESKGVSEKRVAGERLCRMAILGFLQERFKPIDSG